MQKGKFLSAETASAMKFFFKLLVLMCLASGLTDCAEVGLVVPAAAVSGGAAGVNYSFTNNAYKTLSYSVAAVEAALHTALEKMTIKESSVQRETYQIGISAVTATLDINIVLEQITPTVTKIEVSAKKEVFLNDKSTATEIIVQTEKNLEKKK